MNTTRLSQILLTVLSGTVVMSAYSRDIASGISTSYSTNFRQNEDQKNINRENVALPAIFKFTDNNGKITYSSSIPHDFIDAQEIRVAGPPSELYIEETKQINAELKTAAQQLKDAREKREALRDEKEKQRLERLALINSAKPPVVYQQNTYVARPYRYRRAKHYSGYRYPAKPAGKPVHLPAASHHPLHSAPPSGGIAHSHH